MFLDMIGVWQNGSVSQPSQACEASLLTIRQFINCAFLEISLDRTLLCTAPCRFSKKEQKELAC